MGQFRLAGQDRGYVGMMAPNGIAAATFLLFGLLISSAACADEVHLEPSSLTASQEIADMESMLREPSGQYWVGFSYQPDSEPSKVFDIKFHIDPSGIAVGDSEFGLVLVDMGQTGAVTATAPFTDTDDWYKNLVVTPATVLSASRRAGLNARYAFELDMVRQFIGRLPPNQYLKAPVPQVGFRVP